MPDNRTAYAYPTSALAESEGGPGWYVLATADSLPGAPDRAFVDRPAAGPFDRPEDAYDAMLGLPGRVSAWSCLRDGSHPNDDV